VGRVIERCLAKTPDERYQHAGEFAEAVESLRAGVPVQHARFGRRALLLAAGTVLGVAAVIAGFGVERLRQWLPRATEPAPTPIRLVVLPFANLTGDADQEYFSDGLTEELIAQLGRLHPQRLTVIGRTSAMRYKRTDKGIDQIGRELGVDYVLEGSARREATRVRITAQLVQVSNQTQKWSDTYERELAGILALQSDVSRGVARSLAFALLPAAESRLANARPVVPESYEAYLRGNQHRYRLTRADLDTALRYYEQALTADPNFALAYAGIAGVWNARRQAGFAMISEATLKQETALRRALELDDTQAESHVALAEYRFARYEWAGAEQAYRHAFEINPNLAAALGQYSHLLAFLGRTEEALVHAEQAVRVDPYEARCSPAGTMTPSSSFGTR
jgi:TolB-like protein/Tfp pilus assembly protein PilF